MLKTQQSANVFGLLSDPTRLKILDILLESKGELCVNEIAEAVDASPSATSHQLKKLELLSIVSRCRYGQEVCYCLNRSAGLVKRIIKLMKATY